jgi:hypothetical protein
VRIDEVGLGVVIQVPDLPKQLGAAHARDRGENG